MTPEMRLELLVIAMAMKDHAIQTIIRTNEDTLILKFVDDTKELIEISNEEVSAFRQQIKKNRTQSKKSADAKRLEWKRKAILAKNMEDGFVDTMKKEFGEDIFVDVTPQARNKLARTPKEEAWA